MSGLTLRERRDSGRPYKRDTPLKATARRRGSRKPVRHYEALPEEAEVERVITLNPALVGILMYKQCLYIVLIHVIFHKTRANDALLSVQML